MIKLVKEFSETFIFPDLQPSPLKDARVAFLVMEGAENLVSEIGRTQIGYEISE